MIKLLLFKLKSFLTILFLIGSITSFSQTTEPVIKQDSTKTYAPKAIPVLNIIDRLKVTSNKIKDLNKKTTRDASIAKIDSLFPNYENQLNEKLNTTKIFLSASPNRQKINNQINNWNRSIEYLKTWEETIDNVLQKNSKTLISVTHDLNTWQLTYNNAIASDVSTELTNRLFKVTNDLSEIKRAIQNVNNNYLLLESKIALQLDIVNSLIQQLQELKSSSVYNLFYLRHQPLWKTSFKNTKTENKPTEKYSISDDYKSTIEFVKVFEHRFYIFFILIIAIILFYKYLRNGFLLHEIDNEHKKLVNSKAIINENYVFTVLFTCIIIAKVYFRSAPMIINDILIISIIIASLPIVQKNINDKFKNIIYLIILIDILDTLKTYVWFEPYEYRLYLLFEALIVIASVYYFSRLYLKTRTLILSKFSIFLIRLTPIIYFLAIISFVSNLLGYTNLTDITLEVCTHGSILSIMFYAILSVTQAIAFALMHRHYSNKITYEHLKRATIEKKLVQVIRFLVFLLWLVYFLKIIDQYDSVIYFITDILNEPYIFGTVTFTTGAMLSFLIILILSFLITSIVSFIINDDGQGALKFLNLPKGIPAAISLVIRYLIIASGIVLALSSLGVDLSKFNLMAGALGLGIGFGLQNVISNFVSGLILVFERPILTGDTVEVNNLMGTVKKIGVRSSTVSTFDGADVVVPNTNLISNDLINWTLSDNIKRIEILVGTTYNADPNEVLEILADCANNYSNVIKVPAPVALFSDFGESSLNFRLRFWVNFELGLQAKSEVSITVYNKFKEHGIEIPFPQQDIHIKGLPEQNED